MIKLYLFLILLLIVSGCSKNSSDPTPTQTGKGPMVDYEFTVSIRGTYSILYADENENAQTATFTGTSWSKKIILSTSNHVFQAEMVISNPDNTKATGTISVAVNGKTLESSGFAFPSNIGTSLYAMYTY